MVTPERGSFSSAIRIRTSARYAFSRLSIIIYGHSCTEVNLGEIVW
jgi:hypothetical protein